MTTNIMKKETQSHEVTPHEEYVSPLSFLNRFFDDDFLDPFTMLSPSPFGNRRLGTVNSIFPKVDVSETNDEIRVVANIPGIDPDNLNIEVGDDYLSLSGKIEKEVKDEDSRGKVYRYERERGEFRREFALPARVKADNISAKAKNGVLTITLPKSEQEKKHKVKVEIED
jgi:HSP20 family protein